MGTVKNFGHRLIILSTAIPVLGKCKGEFGNAFVNIGYSAACNSGFGNMYVPYFSPWISTASRLFSDICCMAFVHN
jgi:hypothetical protein